MALPASGAISFDAIVAEFGGSAGHEIFEYYRGGAYVPDTPENAGVPTSGDISLFDFYGASALVLDAITVSPWTDIFYASPTPDGTTGARTLTWSVGGARNITISHGLAGTVAYSINGGGWVTYSGAFSVSSGQTLDFKHTNPGYSESGAITVTDATKAATLDVFDVYCTGDF